jgi:hypothetical protein
LYHTHSIREMSINVVVNNKALKQCAGCSNPLTSDSYTLLLVERHPDDDDKDVFNKNASTTVHQISINDDIDKLQSDVSYASCHVGKCTDSVITAIKMHLASMLDKREMKAASKLIQVANASYDKATLDTVVRMIRYTTTLGKASMLDNVLIPVGSMFYTSADSMSYQVRYPETVDDKDIKLDHHLQYVPSLNQLLTHHHSVVSLTVTITKTRASDCDSLNDLTISKMVRNRVQELVKQDESVTVHIVNNKFTDAFEWSLNTNNTITYTVYVVLRSNRNKQTKNMLSNNITSNTVELTAHSLTHRYDGDDKEEYDTLAKMRHDVHWSVSSLAGVVYLKASTHKEFDDKAWSLSIKTSNHNADLTSQLVATIPAVQRTYHSNRAEDGSQLTYKTLDINTEMYWSSTPRVVFMNTSLYEYITKVQDLDKQSITDYNKYEHQYNAARVYNVSDDDRSNHNDVQCLVLPSEWCSVNAKGKVSTSMFINNSLVAYQKIVTTVIPQSIFLTSTHKL